MKETDKIPIADRRIRSTFGCDNNSYDGGIIRSTFGCDNNPYDAVIKI
jgi:hypothetical protein